MPIGKDMTSSHNNSKLRGVLHFVSQNGAKELVKLRRDATIFGREKGDVIIKDNEISSSHCQIQEIGDVYHIFDMNSTNGTYVNNERILKAKLVDGDIITIGQTTLKFSLQDESQVRHIKTVFRSQEAFGKSDNRSSLVDTLIENEFRTTQLYSLVINISYDDGKSEEIELNQRHLYIGRASSFGRFETDPEVSRKHLLIKINDTGEVFIEDQGSTNGTYLNGKKISGMHMIRPKDEIRVGSSRLALRSKAS